MRNIPLLPTGSNVMKRSVSKMFVTQPAVAAQRGYVVEQAETKWRILHHFHQTVVWWNVYFHLFQTSNNKLFLSATLDEWSLIV